jgi:hypothetical protein
LTVAAVFIVYVAIKIIANSLLSSSCRFNAMLCQQATPLKQGHKTRKKSPKNLENHTKN